MDQTGDGRKGKRRLFAAIELPPAVVEAVARLQRAWPRTPSPAPRWTSTANLHLTLTFIGAATTETARAYAAAIASIPPRPVVAATARTGQFRGGREQTVLWLGVDDAGGLRELKSDVDAALKQAGAALADVRFTPHITAARLKGDPRQRSEQSEIWRRLTCPRVKFRFERLTLFESRFSARGADYEPLASVELNMDIQDLQD